jgi:hypothetical protein
MYWKKEPGKKVQSLRDPVTFQFLHSKYRYKLYLKRRKFKSNSPKKIPQIGEKKMEKV